MKQEHMKYSYQSYQKWYFQTFYALFHFRKIKQYNDVKLLAEVSRCDNNTCSIKANTTIGEIGKIAHRLL